MAIVQKKFAITNRHHRFINALVKTGRSGGDRGEVVLRALDLWIDLKIEEELISDADGGEVEALDEADD